jgi:predicted Zn-dependent protease
VLLQQGKLQEAEQVYLDDLANFPRNPWSLKGLQQVYQKQNTSAAKQKLQKVTSDLTEAWQHADKDLQLNSSCPTFSD